MIIYYLYSHNGLYNQFCSWQLLAGISEHFKDQEIHVVNNLYPDKIQNPQQDLVNINSINKEIKNKEKFAISNILNANFENVIWHQDDFFIKDRLNTNLINMQKKYLNVNGKSSKNEEEFAQGRQLAQIDEYKNNIFTQSLVWYSKFFFNRTASLDSAIKNMHFKQEYFDLAKKVADQIGPFNSAHTRVMKDHFQYYMFDQQKLDNGLLSFKDNSLPIYVSVDDIHFDLLKNTKVKHLYIHDILINDFKEDLNNLTYSDNIIIGLLSSLICSMSEDFIGTPYSTFTSFIHQERARNNRPSFKFFDGTEFSLYNINSKPYSWNSLQGSYTWERDWEECKLNV